MTNPYLLQPVSRRISTLVGIYLGLAALIFVSGGFSTMLPAAAAEIGGMELYPLASASSGVLSIAAMPLFGYLGARRPHVKPIVVSTGIAIGATVVLIRAVAPDMLWILAASVFWGLASASIYVLGLSVIRDMFEELRAGVLLGVVGTVSSVGLLLGPTLTGVIIDNLGWRAVGHFTWPILFLAAVLVFFGARPSKDEAKSIAVATGSFDLAGAVLLMVALGCVIVPVSLGSSLLPYGSVVNTSLLATAALAVAGLTLVVRRKRAEAIIPIGLLRDRNTMALSIQIFAAMFAAAPVFFFMPTYVLRVMGGSGVEAGLTVSLYAVPALFLAPVLGRWIGKAGTARPIIVIGTIFKVVVTLLLGLILTPSLPFGLIFGVLFLAGFFNAAQTVTNQVGPQIMIAPHHRVQGNALAQMAVVLGSAIGLAVFSAIITGMGFEKGVPVAFVMSGIAAAAALIPAAFMRRRSPEGIDAAEAAEASAKDDLSRI